MNPAGLRMAGNRDEVVSAIRARAGINVEVISGEEEARLAYLAAGLGAIHFIWRVKKDLREPLVYSAILGVLLAVRSVAYLRSWVRTREPRG